MHAQPVSPKAARRAHQAVAAIFFICGFGFANWLSRIPAVRASLGLSDRSLGLLLLATGLGSLIAFRLAGRLIHAYGSRLVTVTGTASFSLTLCALPVCPNPMWLGAALLALGFFAGFMDVGMNTQAVEVERQRGFAMLSTLHGICSLGSLVGAGTGALAAYFGVSCRLHLLAIAMPLVALSFWAYSCLLPTEVIGDRGPGAQPHSTLMVLGAIGFCASVGEGAMADWLGVYLAEDLATGVKMAGLGYAFFSLTMVLGRLACDRYADKVRPQQLVRSSGALVAAGLTIGLSINTAPSMLCAALLVGLGLAPVIPAILRAGGEVRHVPPSQAISTLATMSYGGFLFGPPSIGLVSEALGLRLSLGLVVVLALLLVALTYWMPRSSQAVATTLAADAHGVT